VDNDYEKAAYQHDKLLQKDPSIRLNGLEQAIRHFIFPL
jgi:hypothetical protein